MGNKGKIFETKFKENWESCFPNSFLFRLNDQFTGRKLTSQNPCDFFAFTHKALFLIECKSHEGKSIPFQAIPQYQRLLAFKDFEGVHPGIVVWFKDHNRVIWVDIHTAEKIYNDGNKSIQLRMLDEKLYDIAELPTTVSRVYPVTDYTALLDIYGLR